MIEGMTAGRQRMDDKVLANASPPGWRFPALRHTRPRLLFRPLDMRGGRAPKGRSGAEAPHPGRAMTRHAMTLSRRRAPNDVGRCAPRRSTAAFLRVRVVPRASRTRAAFCGGTPGRAWLACGSLCPQGGARSRPGSQVTSLSPQGPPLPAPPMVYLRKAPSVSRDGAYVPCHLAIVNRQWNKFSVPEHAANKDFFKPGPAMQLPQPGS